MPRLKFKELKGNEWIGEIDYNIELNDGKRHFRLDLIYLREKYRSKGYGNIIIKDIIEKAKMLQCSSIIVDLTKEDYDYYSPYEKRKSFFENFGFKFDKEGDYAVLNLFKK